MQRLIATPSMEVEWINAVWMWRLRALGQICFASISVLLLVLSLARLFGINLVNWPSVALWITQSYADAVFWILLRLYDVVQAIGLLNIAQWIRSVPMWPFDILASYVFIGSLVRLSEVWMLMSQEKRCLDLGPDFIRDQWAQTTSRQRLWLFLEVSKKYVAWPGRVTSDILGGHWNLSPAIGGGLLLLTLVVLLGATWYFG